MLVAGGAALALAIAGAAFAVAVLATAPGHRLLRSWVLERLEGAVDGHVAIGSIGGSLWRAAEVRDVVLTMPDGAPVIRAQAVSVRFALGDLVRGRIVLSGVRIVRPVVVLEQDSTGRWNVERLFRLGAADTTSHGPRPLVALGDVRMDDGALILRPWVGSGPREYTLRGLTLDLDRLRASHPDSTALEASVRRVALRLEHPALALEDGTGTVRLDADSVQFSFDRLRLAGTRATAAGLVRWGGERTTLDVAVHARPFSFADVRGFAPRLPPDGTGRVAVRVRWLASGAREYDVRELEVATGRSAVRGSGRLTISPSGRLAVRGLDVALDPLDLELGRSFVDSLTARGLVRGTLRADGALADVAVTADLRYADEDAAGAPASAVRGRVRVGWTAAAGFVVPVFEVARASLDLASVKHRVPDLPLDGRLEAAGQLAAAGGEASFDGGLRHAVGSGEPGLASRVHGALRLAYGDSVAVLADLEADTLSFDALRLAWPSLPLRGVATGRVRIEGPPRALGVEASLAGAWGRFDGRGALALTDAAVAVAGEGGFDSLDVSRHQPGLPRTRLSGTWAVGLTLPKGGTGQPSGNAEVALRPSLVEGVRVAGEVGFAFIRDRLMVDSARVAASAGTANAAGALGLANAPPGQITVTLRLDTLAALEPLLRFGMRAVGDTGRVVLDGRGRLTGRIVGTVRAWEAEGDLALSRAEAGDKHLVNLQASARLHRMPGRLRLSLDAYADTVAAAGLTYGAVRLRLEGPPDSLAVRASAAFGEASALRVGLLALGDSIERRILVDTLDFDLPVGTWSLRRPATITVGAATIRVDSLVLGAARGTGRVLAHGALPRGGAGDFRFAADSVPVADLFALAGRDTTGIGGAIDASAHLAGAAAAPAIDLQVMVTDGRFGEYRAPEIQVLGSYADRRLALKGGLWRQGTRAVALSGSVPVDLALTRVAERKLAGEITLSARADTADLSFFSAVTNDIRDPAGRGSFDVRVAGRWDDLRLSGYAEFLDAAVTVPALGVRYRDIDARFELVDKAVRITRASLRGGAGTMALAGRVLLPDPAAGRTRPVLDSVTARLRRFEAFNIRSFGGLIGSGELMLVGPPIGATLSGRLTVDEGYLRFADLVEKRIVNLDDPEFRAIVDSTLARAQNLGPDLQTIVLDSLRVNGFTVVMGPDVWLRSSEANIQLAGEFTVAKDVEFGLPRYRLDGTMRAVRGNYRLIFGGAIAKEFRVTRGTVRFFGTSDFNPEMDIAAEHLVRRVDGGNLTVRAIIGGTLLYPRLRLESDERPPPTETELVSYLLTGLPTSRFTQGGAGQLDPVRNLVYGGVAQIGQELIGGIGLPLDVLTLRPGTGGVGEALGNARIEAGVQIGTRTFVSLNAGLCEVRTSPQRLGVSLEYRLGTQWTTSASVEPLVQQCRTSGGALDNTAAKYQFGFDLFWTLGGIR